MMKTQLLETVCYVRINTHSTFIQIRTRVRIVFDENQTKFFKDTKQCPFG